ncbi:MAG: nucleotide sugar dehydrogenase [Candidatus Micrarchaeia archaeon]
MTYKAIIGMVGLGKLGLSIASCFAYRGFRVFGVDINESSVAKVNAGKAPFYETGLQDLIGRYGGKTLTASTDFSILKDADYIFVIVPTPSTEDDRYSNDYVIPAAKKIAEVLKESDKYKVVSITSTVFPGTMDGIIKPLLETTSGKKCGSDFGLVYNPEFIAVGSLIRDFLNQEMVLIGEDDEKAGEKVASLYNEVQETKPNVARMSMLNAEITKIAYNSFMTTKVTFANMLAELCSRVPGADVDKITWALGMDSRVGNKLIKGSIGYGGPCWPRDNKALLRFAEDYRYSPLLPKAVDAMNLSIPSSIADAVEVMADKGKDKVAILGMSYKPGTPLTVESQSVMLAENLAKRGLKLIVHDPLVDPSSLSELSEKYGVQIARSLEECLNEGTFFVLATPHQGYKNLSPDSFKEGATILDCWRAMDQKFEESRRVKYIKWGISGRVPVKGAL